MTVLVTGGAGYIGSHMVHALVDAGERVVVLDDLSTGFDWALPQGASFVVGDAGDQTRVARLIAEHRIEAIVHFAASVVVPDSVRDPLGYYRNNTVNSRALIEAAVKGGVRHFIFSSTAAVYGNPERVPVCEGDATVPTSPEIGAASYDIFDLSGTWQMNPVVGMRFGVDNLLNKQPPVIGRNPTLAESGGQFDTNTGYYDVLGRRYYVGFRAQF